MSNPHDAPSCGCGHDHDKPEAYELEAQSCGCGHDHDAHHDDHGHTCGCGHHHDHDHDHEDYAAEADASERQMTAYDQVFARYDLNLSDEAVSQRVRTLIADHRDKYDTHEVLLKLFSTIELTTLTVTDSQESVLRLTESVNRWAAENPMLPPLATICVYPNFAKIVSESLEADGVRVACVSGGFPASQTFLEVKTVETALALTDGAEEIDMVLSVGAFLEGDYETCADEIAELKAVCGDRPLKVILETGELKSAALIKRAALLAMYAGADFIKTSTGKVPVAATPEAALVMCQAIKEYHQQTGRRVGFKAAGGIKTVEEAIDFYTIVAETLGERFIEKGNFRIGTSRLANLLASAILYQDIEPFGSAAVKY